MNQQQADGMTVIAIASHDRKRIKVLFEQERSLVLYPGDLRQFHIVEGGKLMKEDYRKLLETVLTPRAKNRALRALQVSDKTQRQLEELLMREGYPEESVAEALAMARQYHYIDDEAYGLRYLKSKGGKKSRRQLSSEMQQKGFSKELVEELLQKHPIDEKAQIQKLLEKKGFRQKETLNRQEYSKLAGMLMRKGYSYDAITEVLRNSEHLFD